MAMVRGLVFPDELWYFMERHVWARQERDGEITVGITALGSALAGEILAFTAKRVGTTVDRDRGIGVIEISKVAASVRSPAAGTIVATNSEVEAKPWLINRAPYGAGWLVRISPSRWNDDKSMLIFGTAVAPAMEQAMYLERYEEAFSRPAGSR